MHNHEGARDTKNAPSSTAKAAESIPDFDPDQAKKEIKIAQVKKAQDAQRAAKDKQKKDDNIGKAREEVEEALKKPLRVINADVTKDANEKAQDMGERELNKETSQKIDLKKGGLNAAKTAFNRFWKGNLFKKYYEKKYEKEKREDARKEVEKNFKEQSKERVLKGIENEEYNKGEEDKTNGFIHRKSGEQLTKNEEATEKANGLISEYAQSEFKDEKEQKQAEKDLQEAMKEYLKGNEGEIKVDNFLEVAQEARKQVQEYNRDIKEVMDGFAVYDATVRDGIRSQAHKDNIDKIIDKVESTKIGRLVPPEAIAAAAGIAAWGVQAATRSAAKAAVPLVGGVLASSVFAGMKEHKRVTEDRNRMMRDVAAGYNYEDDPGKRQQSRKYEKKLEGTLYNAKSAEDLKGKLDEALQNFNESEGDEESVKALISAIADARTRVDYSDENEIDLITYSAGKIGEERDNLDNALIQAEKAFQERYGENSEEFKNLAKEKDGIKSEIKQNVDERDEVFKKLRRKKSFFQAGKTAAISALTFVATQEISAFIDPSKAGLAERLLGRETGRETNETLISSIYNKFNPRQLVKNNVSLSNTKLVEELKNQGYKPLNGSQKIVSKNIPLHDLKNRLTNFHLNHADNNTLFSDGNELGIQMEGNNLVANMNGNSFMGNLAINYNNALNGGRLVGLVEYPDGSTFEIPLKNINGKAIAELGPNGTFTLPDGVQIPGKLTDFSAFTIAEKADKVNGIQQYNAFGAVVGEGRFSGMVSKAIDRTQNFVKEQLGLSLGGGVLFSASSRVGLGGPDTPEGSPTDEPVSPPPNEPASPPTEGTETPPNPTPAGAEGEGESGGEQPAPPNEVPQVDNGAEDVPGGARQNRQGVNISFYNPFQGPSYGYNTNTIYTPNNVFGPKGGQQPPTTQGGETGGSDKGAGGQTNGEPTQPMPEPNDDTPNDAPNNDNQSPDYEETADQDEHKDDHSDGDANVDEDVVVSPTSNGDDGDAGQTSSGEVDDSVSQDDGGEADVPNAEEVPSTEDQTENNPREDSSDETSDQEAEEGLKDQFERFRTTFESDDIDFDNAWRYMSAQEGDIDKEDIANWWRSTIPSGSGAADVAIYIARKLGEGNEQNALYQFLKEEKYI